MATQTVSQFTDEVVIQKPLRRTTFAVGDKVLSTCGVEVRIIGGYKAYWIKDIDGDMADANGFRVTSRPGYLIQDADGQTFIPAGKLLDLEGRRRHLQLVRPAAKARRGVRKAVAHG